MACTVKLIIKTVPKYNSFSTPKYSNNITTLIWLGLRHKQKIFLILNCHLKDIKRGKKDLNTKYNKFDQTKRWGIK